MPVTRFGLEGYGVRRVGSFSGKTPDAGSGPHPVGVLTRFGLEGYGVRRAGAFSGKAVDTTPTPTPTPTGQVGGGSGKRYPVGNLDLETWRRKGLEARVEKLQKQIQVKRDQIDETESLGRIRELKRQIKRLQVKVLELLVQIDLLKDEEDAWSAYIAYRMMH